jgi:hypothetical protein
MAVIIRTDWKFSVEIDRLQVLKLRNELRRSGNGVAPAGGVLELQPCFSPPQQIGPKQALP